VLVSLGSITAFVSWLVREDLKLSAEENNYEVNRHASAETEKILEKTRLLSLIFTRTVAAYGGATNNKSAGVIQEEADYFFSQNPQIAALFFTTRQSGARQSSALTNRTFVNERFKCSNSSGNALMNSGTFNMNGGTIYGTSPTPPSGITSNTATISGDAIYRSGGTTVYGNGSTNIVAINSGLNTTIMGSP